MKLKTGFCFELLMPETTKLLGENKNGENVPHFEITEVVLVHCNIVKNDYQHDSKNAFVPNKSLNQLLGISPKNVIF